MRMIEVHECIMSAHPWSSVNVCYSRRLLSIVYGSLFNCELTIKLKLKQKQYIYCDDYITEHYDTGSHHIVMVLQTSLVIEMLVTNNVKMASFSHQPVHQPVQSSRSQYHGGTQMVFPYNMLLQHVFKSKDGFGVAPQYSPDESLEAIDFTTIYIMERNRHPVLVLDIKPHPNLVNNSRHISTDVQIHQGFNKLRNHIVIP